MRNVESSPPHPPRNAEAGRGGRRLPPGPNELIPIHISNRPQQTNHYSSFGPASSKSVDPSANTQPYPHSPFDGIGSAAGRRPLLRQGCEYFINGTPVQNDAQFTRCTEGESAAVRSFLAHTLTHGLVAACKPFPGSPAATAGMDSFEAMDSWWSALTYRVGISAPQDGRAWIHVMQPDLHPEDSPPSLDEQSESSWWRTPALGVSWRLTLDSKGTVLVNERYAMNIHFADAAAGALAEIVDVLHPTVNHQVRSVSELVGNLILPALRKYHSLLGDAHEAHLITLPRAQQLEPDEFRATFHRNHIRLMMAGRSGDSRSSCEELLAALTLLHGQLVDPHEYITDLLAHSSGSDGDRDMKIAYHVMAQSPFQTAQELLLIASEGIPFDQSAIVPSSSVSSAHQFVRDSFSSRGLPTTLAGMQGDIPPMHESTLPLRLQITRPASPGMLASVLTQITDDLAHIERELRSTMDIEALPRLLLESIHSSDSINRHQSRLEMWLKLARTLHDQGIRTALPDEISRFSLQEVEKHLQRNENCLPRHYAVAELLLPPNAPPPLLAEIAGASGAGWNQARLAYTRLLARVLSGTELLKASSMRDSRLRALQQGIGEHPEWTQLATLAPRKSILGWKLEGRPPQPSAAQIHELNSSAQHVTLLRRHATIIGDMLNIESTPSASRPILRVTEDDPTDAGCHSESSRRVVLLGATRLQLAAKFASSADYLRRSEHP